MNNARYDFRATLLDYKGNVGRAAHDLCTVGNGGGVIGAGGVTSVVVSCL